MTIEGGNSQIVQEVMLDFVVVAGRREIESINGSPIEKDKAFSEFKFLSDSLHEVSQVMFLSGLEDITKLKILGLDTLSVLRGGKPVGMEIIGINAEDLLIKVREQSQAQIQLHSSSSDS